MAAIVEAEVFIPFAASFTFVTVSVNFFKVPEKISSDVSVSVEKYDTPPKPIEVTNIANQ